MEQRENVTEYFPVGTHSEHWGPESTCHVLARLHCDCGAAELFDVFWLVDI